MTGAKRKKNTICATVSPYIKNKVDKLVESGEFSSMSDLVNVALTEFIDRYTTAQMEKYEKILSNVIEYTQNNPEALKLWEKIQSEKLESNSTKSTEKNSEDLPKEFTRKVVIE